METVIVVGASLAGHTVASTLREEGYERRLVVVGQEPHPPYDRPPLSKAFLTGRLTRDDLRLGDVADVLDVDWRLGVAATGLDVAGRRVRLADGSCLEGDLVVIATGGRARTWPELTGAGGPELRGVHSLRTLDDAEALQADLTEGGRLVVLGGGFIGCEVAATARGLGLDVTLVEAGRWPLSGPLGDEVGSAVAALHARRGVDVRCGVGVVELRGTDRVEAVVLADGTELVCDTVVAALGAAPEVGWLDGSGLTIGNGIECDAQGLAAPGVMAVGDCAAWLDPVTGDHRRVEHWTDTFERARLVARAALRPDEPAAPAPTPYFWSDQHDVRLQFAGRRHPHAVLTVEDGSAETEDLLAVWWRVSGPVAVFGMNRARDVARWRRRLVGNAPLPSTSSTL